MMFSERKVLEEKKNGNVLGRKPPSVSVDVNGNRDQGKPLLASFFLFACKKIPRFNAKQSNQGITLYGIKI